MTNLIALCFYDLFFSGSNGPVLLNKWPMRMDNFDNVDGQLSPPAECPACINEHIRSITKLHYTYGSMAIGRHRNKFILQTDQKKLNLTAPIPGILFSSLQANLCVLCQLILINKCFFFVSIGLASSHDSVQYTSQWSFFSKLQMHFTY